MVFADAKIPVEIVPDGLYKDRSSRDFSRTSGGNPKEYETCDTNPTDPDIPPATRYKRIERWFVFQERDPVAFLTDRRNDGAHEVKAAGKIPAASLVDDSGGGSVAVGVQKLVQPLQSQGATSQMVPSKRVIDPPKFRGLSPKRKKRNTSVEKFTTMWTYSRRFNLQSDGVRLRKIHGNVYSFRGIFHFLFLIIPRELQ